MRYTVPCFLSFVCSLAIYSMTIARPNDTSNNSAESKMQLGNFSISLNVKDINTSKEFYEKLGFKVSGGDLKYKYLVMQNDTSTIGLYQGMFEKNSLTFNPGWDRDKKTLDDFQDVRAIQKELLQLGLTPVVAADESTSGPAFLTLVDPDGNPILIDQHVPKPTAKD
jgi:catechol 2,3-dioxygenase-like lactoylglutathione lyase family enzyme